jgi:hypothetical protein
LQISATYTLPEHYDKTVGRDVIHPGVGPANPDTAQKKYHAYYQWVPFVLLFQAILFYFPHYIWRNLESKALQKIIGELCSSDVVESEDKKDKLKPIVRYLSDSRGRHTRMFLLFLLCEVLHFVVVVGNIAFTDVFLGGEFRQYGKFRRNQSKNVNRKLFSKYQIFCSSLNKVQVASNGSNTSTKFVFFLSFESTVIWNCG